MQWGSRLVAFLRLLCGRHHLALCSDRRSSQMRRPFKAGRKQLVAKALFGGNKEVRSVVVVCAGRWECTRMLLL
jgi:hypothetical protein